MKSASAIRSGAGGASAARRHRLDRVRVVGAVWPLAVVVIAAARLSAQPAGRHHPRLDRVRLPARFVEALFPERLRDLEVDVHADKVHQLERPHPEAAADSHDAVDLVVRGDPLAEQPDRFEHEGASDAVGDEADRVGGADRLPAHRPGHLAGDREGAIRGLVTRHDLDQAHQRGRVEEVHAAGPLGPFEAGGDRGHRDRRGVRGQDRLRTAHLRQSREQGALQLQVLRRRLDHELGSRKALELAGLAKPRRGRLRGGGGPTTPLGSQGERLTEL